MTSVQLRVLALSGLALASTLFCSSSTFAQDAPAVLPQYDASQNPAADVFHNFYPNSTSGANSASLYPSPVPTPANVGHTYYTYQPLMPHEMLYAHKRTYYTPMPAAGGYYTGGNGVDPGYGYNRTTISWGHHGFSRANLSFGGLSRSRSGKLGKNKRCGISGCKPCR